MENISKVASQNEAIKVNLWSIAEHCSTILMMTVFYEIIIDFEFRKWPLVGERALILCMKYIILFGS